MPLFISVVELVAALACVIGIPLYMHHKDEIKKAKDDDLNKQTAKIHLKGFIEEVNTTTLPRLRKALLLYAKGLDCGNARDREHVQTLHLIGYKFEEVMYLEIQENLRKMPNPKRRK